MYVYTYIHKTRPASAEELQSVCEPTQTSSYFDPDVQPRNSYIVLSPPLKGLPPPRPPSLLWGQLPPPSTINMTPGI